MFQLTALKMLFQKSTICPATVIIWCCIVTTKSNYFSCLERGITHTLEFLHLLSCRKSILGQDNFCSSQLVPTNVWKVGFVLVIINHKTQQDALAGREYNCILMLKAPQIHVAGNLQTQLFHREKRKNAFKTTDCLLLHIDFCFNLK